MSDSKEPVEPITLMALFRLFLTIGAISFGGGVVAYMREYFVRDRKWMDDDDFLDALEISETLPGLNSVNMSVIVGDRLRGGIGALLATLGMILPGAVLLMVLGVIYVENRQSASVNHFLGGVAAAAVGLLFSVTIQLGHKQLVHVRDALLVVLTFVAVSWLRISLLVVLLIIGPVAVMLYRPRTGSHVFKPFRSREPGRIRRHD